MPGRITRHFSPKLIQLFQILHNVSDYLGRVVMSRLFSYVIAAGAMVLSLNLQAAISLPVGNGESIDLYSKSYALVIGVSDYEHWPDLPGVEKDIDAVGKSLKKHGFTVISLLNPTRDSFDDTMRDFIGDHGQDPENRLIIYYAGHGHTLTTNRGRELGYIVPSNAPLPRDGTGAFKKKAISMLEIEIFAKQMESKHAMFTFDSCFSGSLFEITRAVPDTISLKTSEPVRQFITAGSAEQTVPDKSVFRNQFVAGLEGEADVNKDGFITGTELAQYIEESVTNYSHRAQTPQYGKIRDPYLDKGDFVFINPKMEITINVPGKNGKSNSVDPAVIELSYWNTIKDTKSVEAYEAYLAEYPKGRFVSLAKILIRQAEQEQSQTEVLRQQRLAEERKLVELRKAREEEYKRQQELLEQQRQANEAQLVAMHARQERLAAQRAREESRTKQQLTKEKAAVQVASVKQPVGLDTPGPDKSVSIAVFTSPGNLIDDHHFERLVSDEQLGRYMADTIESSLEKVLTTDNKYTKIVDRDKTRAIVYEGDDYAESKHVCTEYKVDKVVATAFSRESFTGAAEIHFYDCANSRKKVELVELTTTLGEKYYLELDLKKTLFRFYDENPELLQVAN
jgi:hypothetical protein